MLMFIISHVKEMEVWYTMFFMSTGWDYVSELLPLTDILFIPQVMWVGERQWNYIDRGTQKNEERNLSQCHFIHQKSYMDWPGCEPGPLWWYPLKRDPTATISTLPKVRRSHRVTLKEIYVITYKNKQQNKQTLYYMVNIHAISQNG
jgi:hypothetical protein